MSQIALDALLATESSAAVPRISVAAMFRAPENIEIYNIWTKPPADPHQFSGKRLAVVATDGVEEIELTTVLHFFRSRGAQVHLVSPKKATYPAALGLQIPAIRESHILTIRFIEPAGWIAFDKFLDDVSEKDYDAVIIPGGAWNPDSLRAEAKLIDLVQTMAVKNKVVAAICHGPWILADAGLLKGKRATAWWSMKNDLTNAGATYVDEAVVVDGKLVTSRAPIDLARFVAEISSLL